jgi:hypothetical protein
MLHLKRLTYLFFYSESKKYSHSDLLLRDFAFGFYVVTWNLSPVASSNELNCSIIWLDFLSDIS